MKRRLTTNPLFSLVEIYEKKSQNNLPLHLPLILHLKTPTLCGRLGGFLKGAGGNVKAERESSSCCKNLSFLISDFKVMFFGTRLARGHMVIYPSRGGRQRKQKYVGTKKCGSYLLKRTLRSGL